MKATKFKVTLSSNVDRNRETTEVLDQGGIDYEILQTPAGQGSSQSLPKVEANGKTLSSFDPPSLKRFLVAQGAQFEDS